MPKQQLKKEMVEEGKEKLPNLSEELLFIIILIKRIFVPY